MTLVEQYQAAQQGWVAGPTQEFGLIRMQGPDRQPFLQRLLSNDVRLHRGQGCHAFYLNVLGRPLVEFWVFELEQETLLLTLQEQVQSAFAELDKMHFGEKLKFVVDETSRFWLSAGPHRVKIGQLREPMWVTPYEESLALHFPYYSVPHELLLMPPGQSHATQATPELWEVLRLEAGHPRLSELSEKTLFLEFARETDYSETKGCYPGQEVVARILHRGHINKKLCALTLNGELPERGTALLKDGQEVGTWFTGMEHPLGHKIGLGLVRRGSWDPGTVLSTEHGTVAVADLEKGSLSCGNLP